LFITPPPLPSGGRDTSPSARERLRRAHDDLHPSSAWRGAIVVAIKAVDETSPARIRALFWLHDALTALLPDDRRTDSLEQRILRRAAGVIEDELVAHHVNELRIA
jgi:hypothetical protein